MIMKDVSSNIGMSASWLTLWGKCKNVSPTGSWEHILESKTLAPWKKSYDQPRHHIKKQRSYFADKGPSSQSCGFSSTHVWMQELKLKMD